MAVKRALPGPVPVYLLAGLQAAVHAFRPFGVHTVLLAPDLLARHRERLRDVPREEVLIHASDTAAAAVPGLNGRLPPRTAVLTTALPAAGALLATAGTTAPGRWRK
ncbi:hypothetical protein GTU99_00100 [Streptomyces sp. PRKS01-65]|nr:hypothetical protein [Streptomyces harenosi]NEY30626.1 hypothetical protein [Streptomyces harenosi]